MLLHIASSVIEAALQDISRGINIIRLENILRSHREGKHIVHTESIPGKKLLDSQVLSTSETSTLKSILNQRPQTGGLRNILSHYMEIHDTLRQEPWIETRGRQSIIMTPSSWFDDSLMGQMSVLLMENKTDTELIMLLTRAVQTKTDLHNLRTNMEPRGGGGSTIAQEQETLKSQKRISLAIADGDLYSPQCSHGLTATGLLSANTGAPAFQKATVIEARELENLIPTNLYESVINGSNISSLTQAATQLRKLETHITGDWRFYIDLKNGLRQCDTSHYRNTKTRSDWTYIETLFSRIQNNSKTTPLACPTSGNCPDRSQCPSVAFSGFGSNILNHIRNYASSTSAHKLAEHIHIERDNLLTSICETVIAWFCSSHRTAT